MSLSDETTLGAASTDPPRTQRSRAETEFNTMVAASESGLAIACEAKLEPDLDTVPPLTGPVQGSGCISLAGHNT